MVSFREKAHEIVDNISEDGLAEIINYLDYLSIKEKAGTNDKMVTEYKTNDLIDFESIFYEV